MRVRGGLHLEREPVRLWSTAPDTGSRVSIRTETRVLEVEAGKKNRGAEGPAAFTQVRLDAGTDVSVSLREPFLVRIPDESSAGK
jgi:hypothetical protein